MKEAPEQKRSAGILLHPTSLPGPYGIGELGPEALSFVDFLKQAGQTLWQILPLGPTDTAGSPYSSYSAFAGNPLLISTDRLVESGLLKNKPEKVPAGPVDYPSVSVRKEKLLREAYERAQGRAWAGADFEDFREEHGHWLQDYALYAALKGRFGEKPWNHWDEGLARREARTLQRAEKELAAEVSYHQFVQYLFYRQWGEVKRAANEAGIEVIGDIPIFVSQDSADVWANQDLFYLDDSGEPTVVSGVPPDYFSETGQLWGNPLYRWDRMREDGYAWWVERTKMALTQADAVRIDHFRGFEAYWEIAAGEETTKNGRWVEGPGEDLFGVLRKELGTGNSLPLIAEDLGDITPEVHELRKKIGLPGMKVLQFGFSHPENYFLPHNYDGADYVVYTGTHDNDTTSGWWTSASQDERALVRGYLGTEYVSVWDLIRLAHSSVARRAVVPMQDVLGLGSEARMNTPGTASGNWSWRMEESALIPSLADRLRRLTRTYGR